MRLNIAAGTAVRFEPGDTREVELVALGGTREVGDRPQRPGQRRARRRGGPRRRSRAAVSARSNGRTGSGPMKIDRRTYADHYGPTTGDRVRLADTDLIIQIEHDATVYGDEAKFGGGKVIRDGMGQSPTASTRDRHRPTSSSPTSSSSTHRHLQGRRRHSRRPDRRDRQVGQSRA